MVYKFIKWLFRIKETTTPQEEILPCGVKKKKNNPSFPLKYIYVDPD